MYEDDMEKDKIDEILEEFDEMIKELDSDLLDTEASDDIWEIGKIKEWITNMLKGLK
jgi:ElaB/YqjD/DUF883 family membrane-anchored ribosome-binding protein